MEARLYAYLSYADAPAALEWLRNVGFEVVRRQDGPDGTVVHAEARLGEAVVMLASSDAAYERPPWWASRPVRGCICWSTTSTNSTAGQLRPAGLP